MADWRDVMVSRNAADARCGELDDYSKELDDGRASDPALATVLAASAVCAELRALGTMLDYVKRQESHGRA